MQQTEKFGLNLIETEDEIIDSLAAINENFNKIDKNMGTGGGSGEGGITNETDPTVPEYVKNIQESDIEKWNNKQDKLTAGENITIDENGVISSVGGNETPITPYELPVASENTLGGIKIGSGLTINEDGVAEATVRGLMFENLVVSSEDWIEDDTYEQFGARADISCEGVTEEFFSDVVFGIEEAISGNYAPISKTSEGIVTIYAVDIPEGDITIPTIKCIKGA
jgi:hypothetical protein